jgi:solute carrier family 8 (sodium/calcium exchanger)
MSDDSDWRGIDRTICTGGIPVLQGGDTGGLVLPLFGQWEADLADWFQAFVYLMGLFYFFAGVAMAADTFMAAIEKITSVKTRKYDKKLNKYFTVDVWNPTVANLTLMALGSSAPEILLSCIEIVVNEMHSGSLGPSTIVGSAAFNLLVIIAVCVVVIPDEEVRTIKELPVFAVTASFSLFAYIWLIVILLVISPDIVEWWEGLLTFLFFPVLCGIAYLADIGYFHRLLKMNWDPEIKMSLNPNTTKEELTEMMFQIKQKYGAGSDQHMDDLLHFEFSPQPSRAAHRVRTVRQLVAGKKVLKEQFNVMTQKASRLSTMATDHNLTRQASGMTSDHSTEMIEDFCSTVGFRTEHYMIREEDGQVDIWLDRTGRLDQISSVRVYTEDVTTANGAVANEDYEPINETITFDTGESEKKVSIKIHQDQTPEDTEVFMVKLAEVEGDDGARVRKEARKCNVVIIDGDHAGVLRFEKEEETVETSTEQTELSVKVLREKGTLGEITCQYRAEDVTAVAGRDFEPCEGELKFSGGQATASFPLVIKPRARMDCDEFRVVISNASAGAEFNKDTDGREDCCILTVKVKGDEQQSGMAGKLLHQFLKNPDNFFAGTENWKQQFLEAIYVGGTLEEQKQATLLEWTCHVLILPWKLLCACVPPTALLEVTHPSLPRLP